ncbi:MAG: 50S ribosomal protein L24 [Dehalococcoidia bacterium]|jgi:large subunit ribosomal protein L24|nr:50S ribosomal protein L24 [Dehalococcoidia bacterium]
MKIRKDDQILIVAGKDRGRQGKVLRAYPKRQRVVVEGANMVKRHMRARPPAIQGGIMEREAPLHVSNVMLLCNKCHHPVRIGYRLMEDGKKERSCRACGEVID